MIQLLVQVQAASFDEVRWLRSSACVALGSADVVRAVRSSRDLTATNGGPRARSFD
eukprot:COSAG03_NODE_18236_length_359_cov_0.715385_2_plen_55_part_01